MVALPRVVVRATVVDGPMTTESNVRTWKDRECPNCQTPREWEMRSFGPDGEHGAWRCPVCEPRRRASLYEWASEQASEILENEKGDE